MDKKHGKFCHILSALGCIHFVLASASDACEFSSMLLLQPFFPFVAAVTRWSANRWWQIVVELLLNGGNTPLVFMFGMWM